MTPSHPDKTDESAGRGPREEPNPRAAPAQPVAAGDSPKRHGDKLDEAVHHATEKPGR